MLKKRLITFIVSITLMMAVAGASAAVTDALLASVSPSVQAIACNSSGGSGGGC